MYKDIYIFPAVLTYEDNQYGIEFPDLPGALSCANNTEEAMIMAKDCLELHLYGIEEDEEVIPKASELHEIEIAKGQSILLVKVHMQPVRNEMQNKTIKKTLTIPKWLNEVAMKENINFSALLKTALLNELDIKEIREL